MADFLDEIINLSLYIVPGLVAGIILMIFIMGSDARAFMRAKIKKKPIAVVHGQDRIRHFEVVDNPTSAMWGLKKFDADVLVNREAIEHTGARVPIADCMTENGILIPNIVAGYSTKLKASNVESFIDAKDIYENGTVDEKASLVQKINGFMINWGDLMSFLPRLYNGSQIRVAVKRLVSKELPPKKGMDAKSLMVWLIIGIVIIAVVVMFAPEIMGLFGGSAPQPGPVAPIQIP